MQELNNIAFATKPIKLAYMWRDLERRAFLHGLPIKPTSGHSQPRMDTDSNLSVPFLWKSETEVSAQDQSACQRSSTRRLLPTILRRRQ
jgi:hypothetical protein